MSRSSSGSEKNEDTSIMSSRYYSFGFRAPTRQRARSSAAAHTNDSVDSAACVDKFLWHAPYYDLRRRRRRHFRGSRDRRTKPFFGVRSFIISTLTGIRPRRDLPSVIKRKRENAYVYIAIVARERLKNDYFSHFLAFRR